MAAVEDRKARLARVGLARNVLHGPEPQATPPSLFTAVQEQLGLKLEHKKGTVEVIVIDKALKAPTAN
jgi:uncharacterized protein (TIGR03435 family)